MKLQSPLYSIPYLFHKSSTINSQVFQWVFIVVFELSSCFCDGKNCSVPFFSFCVYFPTLLACYASLRLKKKWNVIPIAVLFRMWKSRENQVSIYRSFMWILHAGCLVRFCKLENAVRKGRKVVCYLFKFSRRTIVIQDEELK